MACCGKGLRRTLGAESSLLETARKTRVRRKKAQGVGLLLPRTPMPQSLASFPRCEDFMAPRPCFSPRCVSITAATDGEKPRRTRKGKTPDGARMIGQHGPRSQFPHAWG